MQEQKQKPSHTVSCWRAVCWKNETLTQIDFLTTVFLRTFDVWNGTVKTDARATLLYKTRNEKMSPKRFPVPGWKLPGFQVRRTAVTTGTTHSSPSQVGARASLTFQVLIEKIVWPPVGSTYRQQHGKLENKQKQGLVRFWFTSGLQRKHLH